MGGFFGGITDALGITDNDAEDQARADAKASQDRAYNLSDRQIKIAEDELQFQKDQYQDWKDIYGTLQENLGDYYNNLDGDKLVSLGLENQQKEFQLAKKNIEEMYAQRGLSRSGQEMSTLSNVEVQNAIARATIRSSADDLANEKKLQFLGIGLGQGTQMLANIGNSAANVSNAFTTGVNSATHMSTSYLNNATALTKINTDATQDLWGTALAYGAGKPK
ncbi:MAG: hypothetical protein EOM35_02215 [Negativicutes bacterium]|nr:hypothetical protein [Negativicutes bacterium]